jgi:flagellar motility protein MotE (MotC chaperone)
MKLVCVKHGNESTAWIVIKGVEIMPKEKLDKVDPEKESEETPKTESKGMMSWLFWVGGFMLSFASMMTMMFFFHPAMKARPALEAEADSLAQLDTIEAVTDEDSLGVKPVLAEADSLEQHIEALKEIVTEKERDVEELADSLVTMASRQEQLAQELDTMKRRELELSSAEIKRLSRVFGSMQPRKAAPVLLKMDLVSVSAILLAIDERTAAKILASMPADKAAAISDLIRKRAVEKARKSGGNS